MRLRWADAFLALRLQFFAGYTMLLKSDNYVTRRQSLKVRPCQLNPASRNASAAGHSLHGRMHMSTVPVADQLAGFEGRLGMTLSMR